MASDADSSSAPDRVLDIVATPLLLRILYGLSRGLTPTAAVPEDSDPRQIGIAVQRLVDIGAAQYGPDGHASAHPDHAVLTVQGWQAARTLTVPAEERPGS